MKTSDRNSILETPSLRIRQPKPQIMAYSAYATTGKRPQPILQTYKNLACKISTSKQKENSASCNQTPSSLLAIPSQDSDKSFPAVVSPKDLKEAYSARKHRSFLVTQSQTEEQTRLTNGFEVSGTLDLPNFFDQEIRKQQAQQILETDQCDDDNVFVDPDSLPATSPK